MAEKKLTFEQAMARLEEIVAQLEAGDHPLAESLSLYEEGAKLMKQCVAMLDKAEQKVMGRRFHCGAPGVPGDVDYYTAAFASCQLQICIF